MADLQERFEDIERDLAEARPKEAQSRTDYERLLTARDKVAHQLDLYRRRDRLAARRSQLAARPPRSSRQAAKLVVGVDGGTGHDFARVVQELLEAWKFPGVPQVGFDLTAHDIRVNGKDRSSNGKGVRAVLHAAFKVGVLAYCRRKNLPHPGIVMLDTPLLTYREPLRSGRHGPLAPDELEVKGSALNEYFYASLASMQDIGQFVVLENNDPPAGLKNAAVTVFTGGEGDGRFGLFPRLDGRGAA
jgi:hypothetical protein